MENSKINLNTLTELFNIGFARAGNALSELTNYRVELETPRVEVFRVDKLAEKCADYLYGELHSVNQSFSGSISGRAFMLIPKESAYKLTGLLTGSLFNDEIFLSGHKEVLVETGNILINHCLGVFSNMLKMHITLSIPSVHLKSLENLISSFRNEESELTHVMMIYMNFTVKEVEMKGFMIILLGTTSLKQLVSEIDNMF